MRFDIHNKMEEFLAIISGFSAFYFFTQYINTYSIMVGGELVIMWLVLPAINLVAFFLFI